MHCSFAFFPQKFCSIFKLCPCYSISILHSFCILPFSCWTFFVLNSLHAELFLCCTICELHSIHLSLILLFFMLSSCCTYFSFSTFFVLHIFNISLFFHLSFVFVFPFFFTPFMLHSCLIFSCCTFLYELSSCCIL